MRTAELDNTMISSQCDPEQRIQPHHVEISDLEKLRDDTCLLVKQLSFW